MIRLARRQVDGIWIQFTPKQAFVPMTRLAYLQLGGHMWFSTHVSLPSTLGKIL